MNISPARTAAFDILIRIEKDKAYSSVLMALAEASLKQIDRSLCHELVLGSLRRQIYLDRVIDHFTKGKKIDVEVQTTLRLSIYQLYFLDRIPQYSAINESVNLVQRAKKTSAKGFVNAILRRASRERPVFNIGNEIERIALETSHPVWLLNKWSKEFGIDETAKLAESNNRVPYTAFRLIDDNSHAAHDLIESSRISDYVNGCYIAIANDDRLFDLAERGVAYIQDEASQMVAQAVEVRDGCRILDVCAAPGGKTGLIAKVANRRADLVAAGDLHWRRIETLRDNCRHQGVKEVGIVQYDAEKSLPFADESFDTVLVDAPCSGTGTIRHNPEIRYLLSETDFADLHRKQLGILISASKLVKRGGSVIYSTCSLEREENELVCNEFLSGDPDFSG